MDNNNNDNDDDNDMLSAMHITCQCTVFCATSITSASLPSILIHEKNKEKT